MVNDWTLKDEVTAVAHRWPYPLLAFLLGSILGWLISFALPTPYRAETDLAVNLAVGTTCRNPDDCKNWQLETMNTLATAPDVFEATLSKLREGNPSEWGGTSIGDLQRMLDVSWKNTGTWHLSAESGDAERASQAILAWREVVLKEYRAAYESAGEVYFLQHQMIDLNDALTRIKWRQSELSGVRRALESWRASAATLPQDQPLDDLSRWRVRSLTAQAAGFDPAWEELLAGIPSSDAVPQEYSPWIDRMVAGIDTQLRVLQNQLEILEPQAATVYHALVTAIDESRGISVQLTVDQASGASPRMTVIRPAGLTALVGGVLGVLIWALLWLSQDRTGFRKAPLRPDAVTVKGSQPAQDR